MNQNPLNQQQLSTNSISFTFRDPKNPSGVGRNSLGMETMLRQLFKRAGLYGQLSVIILNTNPDILSERGIRVASHDNRRSINMKIWADEQPFNITVFTPEGAQTAYNKLTRVLNDKRFISMNDLSSEAVLPNPISIPNSPKPSSPDKPAQDKTGENGVMGSNSPTNPPAPKIFKRIGIKNNAEGKALMLDGLRKKANTERIVSSEDLREVIKELYQVDEVPKTELGPVIGFLKSDGFLEETVKRYHYRLTLLVDMLLVRQNLITEAEAAKVLPPLPADLAIRPRLVQSELGKPMARTEENEREGLLIESGIAKAQNVLSEMKSLELAVLGCTDKISELSLRQQAIEAEILQVKESLERFRASLSDPKFEKAKRILEELKSFQ